MTTYAMLLQEAPSIVTPITGIGMSGLLAFLLWAWREDKKSSEQRASDDRMASEARMVRAREESERRFVEMHETCEQRIESLAMDFRTIIQQNTQTQTKLGEVIDRVLSQNRH